MEIFRQLGLVEQLDSGAFYMTDIELMIGQSSTEAERKRAARLENKALLPPRTKGGHLSDIRPPEIEIELEKEIEIEKEREGETGHPVSYTHLDVYKRQENEPELKKSRFISVVVVLFEVFTVWGLITGIQKVWFYYDTRFAFPVQLMFWGNILFPLLTLLWSVFCIIRKKKRECFIAGLLICSVLNAFTAASVAALTNKYYLTLGGGTLNQYLLFVVIDLLFFICALLVKIL